MLHISTICEKAQISKDAYYLGLCALSLPEEALVDKRLTKSSAHWEHKMRAVICYKKKHGTLITFKTGGKKRLLTLNTQLLPAYSPVQSYVQEITCSFHALSVNLTISSRNITQKAKVKRHNDRY